MVATPGGKQSIFTPAQSQYLFGALSSSSLQCQLAPCSHLHRPHPVPKPWRKPKPTRPRGIVKHVGNTVCERSRRRNSVNNPRRDSINHAKHIQQICQLTRSHGQTQLCKTLPLQMQMADDLAHARIHFWGASNKKLPSNMKPNVHIGTNALHPKCARSYSHGHHPQSHHPSQKPTWKTPPLNSSMTAGTQAPTMIPVMIQTHLPTLKAMADWMYVFWTCLDSNT